MDVRKQADLLFECVMCNLSMCLKGLWQIDVLISVDLYAVQIPVICKLVLLLVKVFCLI